MARIPDASALERSAPRARRDIVVDDSAGIVADAMVQQGQKIQQREDRLAYSKARSALARADLEARTSLENDKDWATHETRYRAAMGKALESSAALIGSNSDRSLFEEEARLDLDRGAVSIAGQARRIEVDQGRSSLTDALEANRTAALASKDGDIRGRLIGASADALYGAEQKGYISSEERAKQWQRWREDYSEGFVDMLPPAEQVKALQEDGGPAGFLSPDRKAIRLRQAQDAVDRERREREIEQRLRLTEAKQAMSDRFRDMQVAAQLGIPVDPPPRAVLESLYGAAEGAQRYETGVRLASLSSDVQRLNELPSGEIAATVESYAPTGVAGAAEKAQMQAALASSARQIIDARSKDPAGYLIRSSAPTQRAWEAMQTDPAAAPAYLATVRAEKERLGIAGHAVLPDAYVAQLSDEISTGNANDLADRLEMEQRRWGDAWPDVYAQLAPKLPETAAVIGSGIPRQAATALAATSGLKDNELNAMLPAGQKMADVRADVDSEFDDFSRSMPPEAVQTTAAVKNAALRLSLQYMAQGTSRSNAVRKAHADLVGSQYEMRSIRGAVVRIPVGQNASTVEEGARLAVEQFDPSQDGIAIPPGAALSAEEYLPRWRQYVRENGYWVTRPDAKGLRLYVDGQPVFDRGGAVDKSWEDLTASAGSFTIHDIKPAAIISQ